ncbi:MAG: DUF973 family protein [Desulfurococcales archaeon]|nr:DUF973 family protein [Desulfurococcales archaeon]
MYQPETGSPVQAFLIEGLEKLRMGALLYLVSLALVVLSIVAVAITGALTMPGPGHAFEEPTALLAAMGWLIVALIVAAILALVAFIQWYIASGSLRDADPQRLGIGRTGMNLQIAGVILIILGLLSAIGGAVPVALAVIVIAALMLLAGVILWGVGLMRISEIPGMPEGFKIAGILYILQLIPYIGSILGIIATILVYIYSNEALDKLARQPPARPAVSPPPGPRL